MKSNGSKGKGGGRTIGAYLKFFGSPVVITLIGFVLAYQFIEPAPPKHIRIATGGEEGAYYGFGKQYREILARAGISVSVQSTSGSIENLRLLGDGTSNVDVAFVQGGSQSPTTSQRFLSLGSLYLEPLWVFIRGETTLNRLTELRGKRVAIGGEGSGTKALSLKLLAENGLAEHPTTLLAMAGLDAAKALENGEIDAAFFVASPSAPVVRRLLLAQGIRPMNFERADAYTRNFRFLSRVILPEGAIDFKNDIPSQDTVLLAPAATLVAREDLHPAIIELLLQAATEVHGAGALFEEPGEFPSSRYTDFPLSKDARRFFKYGPPFLQKYLPFWAASLLDRMKVMLLPLITLLFPLFKIVPPTYRWRMRSRINRWYKDLQAVDERRREGDASEVAGRCLAELDRIENEVVQIHVPVGFADALYTLRIHIDFVRNKLRAAG